MAAEVDLTGWAALERELSLWKQADEIPTFWWRDDDAERPTAALDQLIGLSDRFGAPLHLAAVPKGVGPELAARLEPCKQVFVLQHGFAHINHEPKGKRASEVGVTRDLQSQITDLQAGWELLLAAKLPNLLPVVVPPWNRIAPRTVQVLPQLGYQMVSAFDPRPSATTAEGLLEVNCHIDPVRWKEGAVFRGTDKTLQQAVSHLAARRTGQADRQEPTGFLTHHLQTDAATWDFAEALLDRLTGVGGGTWITLASVLKQGHAHG
ncbi:polysaccharide deacetylase family protein [Sulfitobacter mediterraneus]|uniref:polysaccharide deacetylase family protein n=1 Tax=Sulfitobacter mediterraneus TaxID=83219 RepID=UPI000EA35943|nr:polysaccharide deacetylase family protein [Sulfitobacter mediterraneus]